MRSIVHRWSGKPDMDWYPWLKVELEKLDYTVTVPTMPDTDYPRIEPWVATLTHNAQESGDLLLIGHSVGCQTILRYLENTDLEVDAVFVAGWFKLMGLELESVEIARAWEETPIDYGKVRPKLRRSVAMFSRDDPYVPLSNTVPFRDKVGATIIELDSYGHFNEDAGVTKVPELITVIKDWQ